MWTESGQTEMTEITVAFRNFMKAPNNDSNAG
jgi:hypothetical protein